MEIGFQLALGCDIDRAPEVVYSDGLDLARRVGIDDYNDKTETEWLREFTGEAVGSGMLQPVPLGDSRFRCLPCKSSWLHWSAR